jgi:hypothetical protein
MRCVTVSFATRDVPLPVDVAVLVVVPDGITIQLVVEFMVGPAIHAARPTVSSGEGNAVPDNLIYRSVELARHRSDVVAQRISSDGGTLSYFWDVQPGVDISFVDGHHV